MPKKGNRKKKAVVDVSPTTLSYKGPIQTQADTAEVDLHTTVLKYTSFIYSNASGKFVEVFGSSPASTQDWSSYTSAWQEFRVLGWELIFYPSNRYSKASTICNPVARIISRDNATALTTYLGAAGSSSYKMLSFEDPFKVSVHMQGVTESQFLSTSSPTSVTWIKFYSELLSVSTLYGLIEIVYRVQFRGRA